MHEYSLAKRSNMLWVPIDEVQNIDFIKKALTIVPRYKELSQIPVYMEEGEWFGFPRNYSNSNGMDIGQVLDETTPGLKCDIQFTKSLRDYQIPIMDKITKEISKGNTDLILLANTGAGKTVMLLWLAAQLGRTVLVLVPKTDLVDSWIEKILFFTNITREEIGIARQDKCEYLGKKIVIGMIHSVCKDKYPEEFKRYFGVYFMDECLHPSHDILTNKGWVTVADITTDDLVAQYDIDTYSISFIKPTDIIKNPFKGKLVNITGRRYDLMGTPNHEQPYYDVRIEGAKRRTLSDMKFYKSLKVPIAGNCVGPEHVFGFIDRFRIMHQADGTNLYFSKTDSSIVTVRFSFSKQRKIERALWILNGLGWEYKKTYNKRGDCNITVKVDYCYSKKDFSWVCLDSDSSYYIEFLDELYRWDGWSQKHGRKFYSSIDKANVEVVQIICTLSGSDSTFYAVEKKKENHNTSYAIGWGTNSFLADARGFKKTLVQYEGYVHCVRVPKGNIVVRRNNKISVTGNCQKAGAFHFSKTAGMFPAKYRIGVTAELKRGDGMEEVATQHFGSNKVTAGGQTQPVPSVIIIHSKTNVGSLPKWLKTVIQKRGALLSLLADNNTRNRMLVGVINDVLLSKRQTLVISERIPQLETLRAGLIMKGHDPKKMGLYLGRTSEKERTRVSEECDCIFATTKMVDIGTDIPTLRALVFATPLADINQPVGRIRRINEGMADPVVIDIYDTAYPETGRWLNKRRSFYEKIGSKIKERVL